MIDSTIAIAKVPRGLPASEYYRSIYNWCKQNRNLAIKENDAKETESCLIFVNKLPIPDLAGDADIAFVCKQMLVGNSGIGLEEWAYNKRDESDIMMFAYATVVLNEVYGGNTGQKVAKLVETSELRREFIVD